MKSNNTVTELFNEVYKHWIKTGEHKKSAPTIPLYISKYHSMNILNLPHEAASPEGLSDQHKHHEIKCSHDWKEYIGFTERYNYCTKCDNKENQ